MVERLAIMGLGARGDGVASSDAGAIYVPYTLPGEIVEVDPWPGHPDRRNLLRVETTSPARVPPICPHFGVCGGCALQHWDAAPYRAWKREAVVAQLRHAGITAGVADLIDAHGEGRRRAVFHARRATHDILQVGFAALRAHRIIPIDRCPILAPGLAGVIDAAWAIAEALKPTAKPLDIQATATDTGIDVDVRGSGPLTPPLIQALARVADTHGLARITRHGELITQRATPTVQIGRATVTLPPGVFLQATALGEETLARLVLEHVGGAKTVADLFAGVGPFALRLAEGARVLAADSDAAAIEALRRAGATTPGLKPIAAEQRDLFRRPFVAPELVGFDAVVFDPPRQGAEAQARELGKSRIPIIVAVSCNPVSFARDAKILIEGGYRLGEVTPVDQFRYSAHVEVVARLAR
ncbi:MAG TPA: RNA methyltransferase [Xanthobacteraceae bacterium]|nr:RNA methyltransferase [Xanthobacteraceae bacterium]